MYVVFRGTVKSCMKTLLYEYILTNDKYDTSFTHKYIYLGFNTLILNMLHICIDCISHSTIPIYSCIPAQGKCNRFSFKICNRNSSSCYEEPLVIKYTSESAISELVQDLHFEQDFSNE